MFHSRSGSETQWSNLGWQDLERLAKYTDIVSRRPARNRREADRASEQNPRHILPPSSAGGQISSGSLPCWRTDIREGDVRTPSVSWSPTVLLVQHGMDRSDRRCLWTALRLAEHSAEHLVLAHWAGAGRSFLGDLLPRQAVLGSRAARDLCRPAGLRMVLLAAWRQRSWAALRDAIARPRASWVGGGRTGRHSNVGDGNGDVFRCCRALLGRFHYSCKSRGAVVADTKTARIVVLLDRRGYRRDWCLLVQIALSHGGTVFRLSVHGNRRVPGLAEIAADWASG